MVEWDWEQGAVVLLNDRADSQCRVEGALFQMIWRAPNTANFVPLYNGEQKATNKQTIYLNLNDNSQFNMNSDRHFVCRFPEKRVLSRFSWYWDRNILRYTYCLIAMTIKQLFFINAMIIANKVTITKMQVPYFEIQLTIRMVLKLTLLGFEQLVKMYMICCISNILAMNDVV